MLSAKPLVPFFKRLWYAAVYNMTTELSSYTHRAEVKELNVNKP